MNPYVYPFWQQVNVAGLHSFGPGLMAIFGIVFLIAIAWALVWQGIGLWYAARNRQWGWFVAFLIVHTLGILEIIYLLFFRKDKNNIGSGTTTTTYTATTITSAPTMSTPPTPPATGDSSAPVA